MESISVEDHTLRSQLATMITQAAYLYYYNPYAGYSVRISNRGWQQAMPYYPQGTRATTHSPVALMQPLSMPGNTPAANNR
ncbi:hypothetical protein TIFTF001_028350 [Ficus carica]|uniref:Uncharacterized protein n=1 Tax=Ficus carica TaxID=3494 RepID=A0AA88DPM4_FICCA|nr:hypothetical protein TIFTF001_028350 [Ficus carica]